MPARLLYSSRSLEDVIYRDELDRLVAIERRVGGLPHADARATPGLAGFRRRIDAEMLSSVAWSPSEQPLCFVCGPTPLVESAANALVNLGHEPARIKTERFGPTGG